MIEKISKIGVLGAGQMGLGIAQVFARAGFQVILGDQTVALADQGKNKIQQQLQRIAEKGKITQQELHSTIENIKTASKMNDFQPVDFLIEAVSESLQLKTNIFKQLDEICSPSTIFTSNTSSISITVLAATTRRPEKFAGMHFMNPVPLMTLVEGIRGLQTSNETFQTVRVLTEKLGKTLVESKDQPGFIVNRVLMPMINESIQAVYEGIATVQDIDTSMKLGTNHPMGPLQLADFIGLDTCLAILNILHEGFGDPKYRPSPLLKSYVAAGWLGKKTKKGFYSYDSI